MSDKCEYLKKEFPNTNGSVSVFGFHTLLDDLDHDWQEKYDALLKEQIDAPYQYSHVCHKHEYEWKDCNMIATEDECPKCLKEKYDAVVKKNIELNNKLDRAIGVLGKC